MDEEGKAWVRYGELFLKELERLNNNYEGLRKDFEDVKKDIAQTKATEQSVKKIEDWKQRVDDVMSPTQMKEMKDEVYTQKNKWTATVAIITFVQILFGVALGLMSYYK